MGTENRIGKARIVGRNVKESRGNESEWNRGRTKDGMGKQKGNEGDEEG